MNLGGLHCIRRCTLPFYINMLIRKFHYYLALVLFTLIYSDDMRLMFFISI